MASPSFSVIVDPKAQRDLIALEGQITEAAGSIIAQQFVERLFARIKTLTYLPERTRPIEINGRTYRRLLEGSYAIYYEMSGEAVIVLRVLHGAQDTNLILSE